MSEVLMEATFVHGALFDIVVGMFRDSRRGVLLPRCCVWCRMSMCHIVVGILCLLVSQDYWSTMSTILHGCDIQQEILRQIYKQHVIFSHSVSRSAFECRMPTNDIQGMSWQNYTEYCPCAC